jgi:hypothetical protein
VSLAHTLAGGKDWRGAAAEFRRLAIAFPDSAGYAFDAATAFMQAGDSTAGIQWLREAARRPGAPAEVVRAVKAMDKAAKDAKASPAGRSDGKAKKPKRNADGTLTR